MCPNPVFAPICAIFFGLCSCTFCGGHMSKWEIEYVKWKVNTFLPRWGGCRIATGGVQQLNPLPSPIGEGRGEVVSRRGMKYCLFPFQNPQLTVLARLLSSPIGADTLPINRCFSSLNDGKMLVPRPKNPTISQ